MQPSSPSPSRWSLAIGALAMLGSLTAVAAFVVADVAQARALEAQEAGLLDDGGPLTAEHGEVKKVRVLQPRKAQREAFPSIPEVRMGGFEGY